MWKKVRTYQELPNHYWDIIISNYLPGYTYRDEVLESDILGRYVENEEVCVEDLEWLPESKEEARIQLERLDLILYNEAVDARADLIRMKWGLRRCCKNIQHCKEFVVYYRYLNDFVRCRVYNRFYPLIDGICENYVPGMLLLKVKTEDGMVDILEWLKHQG